MKLEIRWHPRIGDAIVQRGIFQHYLRLFNPSQVVVPATPEAFATVWHLYGHDARNANVALHIREVSIDPREHDYYREPYWEDSVKVTIGAACPTFDYSLWDQSFYDQAGVDVKERFTPYANPEEDLPAEVLSDKAQHNQRAYLLKQRRPGRKLALFHETRFKRLPAEVRARYSGRMDWKCLDVSPILGSSILYWAPVMLDATVMHMVDSGPANLANSLTFGDCETVIYAQDTPPPTLLKAGANVRVQLKEQSKP